MGVRNAEIDTLPLIFPHPLQRLAHPLGRAEKSLLVSRSASLEKVPRVPRVCLLNLGLGVAFFFAQRSPGKCGCPGFAV